MDEEIKDDSLLILSDKFKDHHLYNKILAIKRIYKGTHDYYYDVFNINDKDTNEYGFYADSVKIFNPNDFLYHYRDFTLSGDVAYLRLSYIGDDIEYLIKFKNDPNNLEINLKECTLIKKEIKLMRYKVKTKLIVNFPENTIIEKHQTSNVYKSNNDPCIWLTADLVENNPGFFEKIEFTGENIKTLNKQIEYLETKFVRCGTSENFIKEFKAFEKMVKELGELF